MATRKPKTKPTRKTNAKKVVQMAIAELHVRIDEMKEAILQWKGRAEDAQRELYLSVEALKLSERKLKQTEEVLDSLRETCKETDRQLEEYKSHGKLTTESVYAAIAKRLQLPVPQFVADALFNVKDSKPVDQHSFAICFMEYEEHLRIREVEIRRREVELNSRQQDIDHGFKTLATYRAEVEMERSRQQYEAEIKDAGA